MKKNLMKKVAGLGFVAVLLGSSVLGKESMKENQKGTQKQELQKKTERKTLFQAKTKTLSNGLRVVVVEDHMVPRVSIGILYNVGSGDDPDDFFGVSHMLEHMLFRCSEKYPDLDATIENVGGSSNAETSYDHTMYVYDCPTQARTLIFDIAADQMAHFSLNSPKKKDIFKTEQMAVLEERLMRYENPPLGIPIEYIGTALSPQHPYGRMIGGSRKNIRAYTPEAVMNHYKKWYKPNNATVIVVGDVRAPLVFAEVEKTFGAIPKGPVPERKREQNALTKDFHQDIVYYSDKVQLPRVSLSYNAPHFKTSDLKKIQALSIGLGILFEGSVYKFSRYFLDEKDYVASLDCSYGQSFDPRPLVVSASIKISVEKFLKEFDKKLKKVLKNGVASAEFERAKKSSLTRIAYRSRDGHEKIRSAFVDLANDFTVEQIENTPNIIELATSDDVNAALREVFSVPPLSIVKILPKKEVRS
ncbi:peptidase M16 [Alphaproteobacteria bacterium]|nr:peptidase M16 [Alphaproteobacteria bacterium]GHS98624.1 peptidase M16 [Alphaproteobacteria bacterium]